MSKHKRYERQIADASKEAFKNQPVSDRSASVAARSQLYTWLINMDRISKAPGNLASDAMANTACNVFEKLVLGHEEEKWKSLVAAFQGLTDDDQLNLFRTVLAHVFQAHAANAALMTKANDLFMWENTGFHSDSGVQAVFAKVGRKSFQAIGFDDGEAYIGTEGSKTLWNREFSMALMIPYPAPFQVASAELEPQKISDEHRLSDRERERMVEALELFETDLTELVSVGSEEAARADAIAKIREGIKLMRIRLPRLDDRLDKFSDEHPEVGADFENIAIEQLLASTMEWMRMRLDDDTVRREVEGTTVIVGDATEERRAMLQTIIDGILVAVPKEGALVDGALLKQRLHEAAVAAPGLKQRFESEYESKEGIDVLKAAQIALVYLNEELENLS